MGGGDVYNVNEKSRGPRQPTNLHFLYLKEASGTTQKRRKHSASGEKEFWIGSGKLYQATEFTCPAKEVP